MLSSRAIRVWTWLHKWTSLVCTLFMLLLCLTGLPLIFHHEIGHLLGDEIEAPELPAAMDKQRVSLDVMAKAAMAVHPTMVIQFAGENEDDPRLYPFTSPHGGIREWWEERLSQFSLWGVGESAGVT